MKRALFFLLAIGLLSACSPKRSASSSNPAPGARAQRAFATSWQNESQYIVESIASDLAEMSRLAGQPPGGAAGDLTVGAEETSASGILTYRVTVTSGTDTFSCDLPMNTPIWAPATYAPLAAALAVRFPVKPGAGDTGERPSLPLVLAAPTAEILARTDVELSALLDRNFANAELHREAALLLGAFTLREASGKFYDIRGELCRMTAHLALARSLAPAAAPSAVGRLAEAALTVLYNNQADALALLDPLPDTDGFDIWKTALRLRATSDYRNHAPTAKSTLLETREWFRARARAVSADRAWLDLPLDEAQRTLPDWTRIVAQESFPIALGHKILRTGLTAELQECALVFPTETGRKLEKADLSRALNVRPVRFAAAVGPDTPSHRIIGWGLWAASLQRHLCHAIEVDFTFMNEHWGVPDEAAKFRDQMDQAFWGLRLYPFVRRLNATAEPYYRAAQDEARAVMMQSPEAVPAEVWNYTCYTVPFCALYVPPPHAYVNEWHLHNPPPGTAYNPYPRMNQPSLVDQPDTVPRLEQLHRLAPYDTSITHNLLRIRDGEKQRPEKLAEAYRDVLDFNPMPSRRIARLCADQPADFEKWMRRAVALDPSDGVEIAAFYEKAGREKEAAEAYIQWLPQETDEVQIAAKAGFLIAYFEKNGRRAEATALADRAARTYSFAGLLAKARLLEGRADFNEAYDFYQKIHERYDAPADLMGFLWRTQKIKPSPRFAKALDELIKDNLPGGLIPFAGNSSPPNRGVVVRKENDALRNAGLRTDDVVVAVRGYQVADWSAFKILRTLDSNEPFALKIWRQGAYLDLAPLPANYRFGVNLDNYQAP